MASTAHLKDEALQGCILKFKTGVDCRRMDPKAPAVETVPDMAGGRFTGSLPSIGSLCESASIACAVAFLASPLVHSWRSSICRSRGLRDPTFASLTYTR